MLNSRIIPHLLTAACWVFIAQPASASDAATTLAAPLPALARVDPTFSTSLLALRLASGGQVTVFPQADGGILVSPLITVPPDERASRDEHRLIRLQADGSFDPVFHPRAALAWSATRDGISHVATPGGAVVRLSASGEMDPDFTYGRATNERVLALKSLPGGGVWVASQDEHNQISLALLQPNGQPERVFQQPGLMGVVREIVPTPDGALLVLGTFTVRSQPVGDVAVFKRDGSLAMPPESHWPKNGSVSQIAVLPDGRVLAQRVAGGEDWPSDMFGSLLVRCTALGVPDPAFTFTGIQSYAIDGSSLWTLRFDRAARTYRLSQCRWEDDSASAPVRELSVEIEFSRQSFWLNDTPIDYRRILTADSRGGLFLNSVAVVNGYLHSELARLDLTAPAETLVIAPSDARVGEDAGHTLVSLIRGGPLAQGASFRWRTADGTARAGVDYNPGSGELTFSPGEASASIPLSLIDNQIPDGDRFFWLDLANATGEKAPPVQITIVNDEPGFIPGTSALLPNGQLLLRPTGHLLRRGDKQVTELGWSTKLSQSPTDWSLMLPWQQDYIAVISTTKLPRFFRLHRFPPAEDHPPDGDGLP